tara:strand:+ start:2438 stop:3109 length:672 start_codon:yes stop_codon:yes gene_type:complete
MGSQSDFLEIIILGAIAAFLIYRLVSTLGQKSGFQQPISKENLGDIHKPDPGSSSLTHDNETPVSNQETGEPVPDHLQEGVALIQQFYPEFSLSGFLEGATNAYEMIVEAFARGDEEVLKSLMDKRVFSDFQLSIKDRLAKKLALETTIVRICTVVADRIEKVGTKIQVSVSFVTEQTHVMKDQEGAIVEGSPSQVEEVTDQWTFSRPLKSQNPNWLLVATGE